MKERKFSTPVSMKVTKEQYEKDLKKPLEELGYEEECFDSTWQEDVIVGITTNFRGINNQISNVINYDLTTNNRTFIDHYNPKLFLALAAMTEGEDSGIGRQPIVGEWVIAGSDIRTYDEGYMEMRTSDIGGYLISPTSWRKATKEELINHFSEETKKCAASIINNHINNSECTINYVMPDGTVRDNNNNVIGYADDPKESSYKLPKHLLIDFEKEYLLTKELEKTTSRFPFELDLEGARKIIECSCKDWRSKLRKKWSLLLDKPTIKISESFYKEMRNACDDKQHKVLDEVFGKDEKSVADTIEDMVTKEIGFAAGNVVSGKLLETFDIKFKE